MMRFTTKISNVVILFRLLVSVTFVQGQQIFDTCEKRVSLKLDSGNKYGILTSPNYPTKTNPDQVYPANLDCEWHLPGTRTTLVQFKIWGLSIQPGRGGSNVTCDYDYLFLQIDSHGTKKYCGTYKPDDLFQGMGNLLIRFHSDARVNYRGFRSTFQQTLGYNPCNPNPCKDGSCQFNIKTLLPDCACPPGITGRFCEEDIDECMSRPCKNGGYCKQDKRVLNKFECTCRPGFKGFFCEIEKQSPCVSDPCQYGGTCVDINKEAFRCNCLETYQGLRCEKTTGCENPGIPNLTEYKRFLFGSTLRFSCDENYVIVGAENATCLPNGSWSGQIKAPECKLEGMENGDPGLSFWSKAMIGLGSIFAVQLIVFVTWMVYKSPWAIMEKATAFATNNFMSSKENEERTLSRADSLRNKSVSTISEASGSEY